MNKLLSILLLAALPASIAAPAVTFDTTSRNIQQTNLNVRVNALTNAAGTALTLAGYNASQVLVTRQAVNADVATGAAIDAAKLANGAVSNTELQLLDGITAIGNVFATSTFGTDNILLRSDGTGRNVQSSGITVDDSNNLTVPGTGTFGTPGVGAIDIGTTGIRVTGNTNGSATFLGLTGAAEDFTLAQTANTWTITSSTAANIFNFSGFTLQQSGVAVASSGTTLTIAGTALEITSSAGAQDLSANRTWTLSLPAVIDLGGKTSFELPNAAAPTVDAFGEIAGDNNLWAASRGAPVFFDGTAAVGLIGALVSDAPANGQYPRWNTGGTITWESIAGGGDVVGPASAVDNAVSTFDGTSGKLIKESPTIMTATYNQFVKGMLMNAEIVFGGILSPAQITANQNDYTPSGITNNSVLRLNSDASRNITGLRAMLQDGGIILIHNIGAQNIVFIDESASSTAEYRFALSANLTLAGDQSALFQYDGISLRWRLIGGTGGAAATVPLTIGFTTDGAGTAITTGVKGYYAVKNAFTITGYSMMTDQTGSVVVDIWLESDPYDGSNIVDNAPVVADTITASAKPTLSTQRGRTSTTLTGWTTTVPAGSMIGWNIDSASTITRFTFELHGTFN